MYTGIFIILFVLALFMGGIAALIVYLVKRKQKDQKMDPLAWKRVGLGLIMSFILPYFIGFSTSAVFDKLVDDRSFIMMIAMSVIFLIIGLIIAHHTVVSTSLIIGSTAAIIYILILNIEDITPSVMAIVAGIGLAILIFFAYKKLQEKEAE
ncbi:MAG: hypothetical protein HW405_485 [Candidatus Berkelbacteria bacterium]|nr:hypothetical protein [Candidatus Berkelbacteria bacterium]